MAQTEVKEKAVGEVIRVQGDGTQTKENFFTRPTTRRRFLQVGATSVAGIACASTIGAILSDLARAGKTPIIVNAQGVLLAEPARCTGCRRCELACTEFNEGKSHPVISRIKVFRNYNFGPMGPETGFYSGEGKFGNMRLIPETCKQCPHPVPCADVCPNEAIEAHDKTGARMINAAKCVGCKICLAACPWDMLAYDPDSKKMTKCFLCNGKPECVEACPTGAVRYIKWRDLTRGTRIRRTAMKRSIDQSCLACHR
jgi:Fe-S-cluster-containing dehydrogenase component